MEESVYQAAKCLYDFMSACETADTAELILVLGSHDFRVPGHAAALYLSGAAPLIVCTGGYGKMTEGAFPKPEGVLFAERCVGRGVPPEAVLIEDRAANTGENFSFSQYAPDEAALIPEIELMVGDLQRLRVYAEKGYHSPVHVPPHVWDAWNFLRGAGFSRYVL